MKIFIIFQFCFVVILSVSAHQVPLPVQQYPVYQQSVYNTPAIPVVYQAASYNNPCNPQNTIQNPSPNQIANALVSKVLSNPAIHRVLDPNVRFYNPNGGEFQNHLYNSAPVPNIINNYFIVSPEYLKFNESELITEVLTPQIVNTDAKHNAVDNVDILTVPQYNIVTKENLVQATPDYSQSNVANLHSTPRRKVRRKKAKKRIRNKIVPALNRAQETMTIVPMDNHEVNPTNVTINSNNDVKEEIISNSESRLNNDKAIQVEEAVVETINQPTNSSNSNERPKKKSKKRKQKTTSNSTTDSNTGPINNVDISKVITEDKAKHVEKDTTDHKMKKNDVSNGYFVPDSPIKELNEQCFEDIGSLITCLGEAETRVTRNSQDDVILRDFLRKFPQVPENVARSMLSYAQHQYQNQMNSNCNNYCPGNTPYGYNHLFQMPFMNNFGKSNIAEMKPRTISRRRKNKKKKGPNKTRKGTKNKTTSSSLDTTTESTTAQMDKIVTVVEPTTEILNLQFEEIISTDTHPTIMSTVTEPLLPITEEISIDYTKIVEPEETHVELEEASVDYEETDLGYHEDEIHNLGEEYPVPLIYTNGLIDDYYPSFTDNIYHANNNEFTVADVSDRYYYTTDRNIDNTSRDRTKSEINFKETIPKFIKQSFRDTKPKHTYFDADRESYKNLIKEIIQPKVQLKPTPTPKIKEESFKTPPGLENPDFRTKRIDKNAFKSDEYRLEDSFDDVGRYFDYGEKSSIYSNAKTPLYNSRTKPSPDVGFVLERPVTFSGSDVETSFARSKVAKYGVDENDDNASPEVYHSNDEHEEISVVTAQSLRYPDDLW